MASAAFVLEDTQEARTEISLLLQIEPSQLDKMSHNGLITVEFPNLLEDKALHVISGAVSNHGFVASIEHAVVKNVVDAVIKAKAEVSSTIRAIQETVVGGGSALGKSKTKEPGK